MIRIALRIAALAAGIALPLAAANACSVVSTYKVPTALELAEKADTIILGTVESETKDRDDFIGSVQVRPTLLLKGANLPERVALRGTLFDGRGHVTRSDPDELWAPNPDALSGGCTRYVFEKGMQLVLFLERGENGQLRFASYPFARVAEDVPSADARWVKAVRLYVEIATLPKDARRAALIARRNALRTQAGDSDGLAIADDIDRHLKGKRIAPYD
jgi:hypothetical protein